MRCVYSVFKLIVFKTDGSVSSGGVGGGEGGMYNFFHKTDKK